MFWLRQVSDYARAARLAPEIESPMSGLAIAAIKYPANAIGFLFRSLSEWVRQAVGAHFVHNAYLAELRGLRSLGVWIENPGDE